MNYVLDTNVLVAAIRSPSGASAEILRRVLQGKVAALCSVPLFMEYEAVLLRQEHLTAAGANVQDVVNVLGRFNFCGVRNCGIRMTIWCLSWL